MKADLEQAFWAAVDAAHPGKIMAAHLRDRPANTPYVFAVGKAAGPLAEEVEAVKGEMIQSSNRLVVDRNKPRNFGLWCTVSGLLLIMFCLAMVN